MPSFNSYLTRRRIPRSLLGAAVACIFGETAIAETSANFTYSGPKAGIYAIPPLAFSPSGEDTAAANYSIRAGSISASGGACFNTGVFLPQNAALVALDLHYASYSRSNLSVTFMRQTLATGDDLGMIYDQAVDNSNTFKSATFPLNGGSERTVNNALYAYGFQICVGAGTRFYNARIRYTYTSAGD